MTLNHLKINDEDNVIEDKEGNKIELSYGENSIHADLSKFMVCCWGRYL